MSLEEPPWSFSESTFPLSSAFVHHELLLDLAFKQSGQNEDLQDFQSRMIVHGANRVSTGMLELLASIMFRFGSGLQFAYGGLYQGIDSGCNLLGQLGGPIRARWLHAEEHYLRLPLGKHS